MNLLNLKLSVALTLLTGWMQTFAQAADSGHVQVLSSFHRPESVAFSLDGKTLFVSNCGSDVFGPDRSFVGFVRGNGSISKLSVDDTGHVTVDDLRFIEGLSANVGIAVLPRATARFPKGTLLVNHGIALQVNAKGKPVTTHRGQRTGIRFFNPDTGRQLGELALGAGSKVAQILGHITLLPNSLAFDADGNLYVTDTAKGGDRLKPKVGGHPGLIRIEHGAIDALTRKDKTKTDEVFGQVSFTPIPGVPNGVGYWADRKAVCVVTMGGQSPEGTAIYVIPETSFPRTTLPAPLKSDVGTADGIAFTPAGTIITSRFAGDILAVPSSGEPFVVEAAGKFAAPADHRLLVLGDGSCLLAIPDQDRKDPAPCKQDVKIVKLPKGF